VSVRGEGVGVVRRRKRLSGSYTAELEGRKLQIKKRHLKRRMVGQVKERKKSAERRGCS